MTEPTIPRSLNDRREAARGRTAQRAFAFGEISPQRIESDHRQTTRLLFDLAAIASLTAADDGLSRPEFEFDTNELAVSVAPPGGRDAQTLLGDPERVEDALKPVLPVHAAAARSAEPLTCLIADDHPIVSEAIAGVLAKSNFSVVGRARTGTEALSEIEKKRPRVALVDLMLPSLDGSEVARRASRTAPETAVVLYTGADPLLLSSALGSGARGFLLKEAPIGDLARAVKMVAEGQIYIDPALAGFLAGLPATRDLDSRELEILRLLADGCTNEEIAGRLFLSSETVRSRVRKLMTKLNAHTRTEAVASAIRQRLIA